MNAWEQARAPIATNADPATSAELRGGEVVTLPVVPYFTDKGQIVPARLGAAVRAAGHIENGTDGRLYHYYRGVYRPDGDAFARGLMRQYLGYQFRRADADEVMAWLLSWEPVITHA